jgi:uncharacterized protein (TIGR00369 family)
LIVNDATAHAPDGLEQLRHIFFGAAPYTGIGKTLDFRPVELEAGRVVFEGNPDERFYNPIGTVHGGYAAALLDSAVGCAVHSRLTARQGYMTLELKIAYHRALTRESGPVRSEGTVVSLGRRAAFAEGKLVDAQGRLCASATSTLLIFEK